MALFYFVHYKGDYMQHFTVHFEDTCRFELFKTKKAENIFYADRYQTFRLLHMHSNNSIFELIPKI